MKEENAELRIKQAARKVFLKKGMTGARMQEIADEAGMNKALLHYYYRNKEQLFASVFEEIIKEFIPKLIQTLNKEIPLEVKVYQVADSYISFLTEHPEIPLFILNELQRHPDHLVKRLNVGKGIDLSILETQLEAEAIKGSIISITLENFMMNLISLMVFPFASRHLFQNVMKMSDQDFHQFIQNRKIEVPQYFMNALRP